MSVLEVEIEKVSNGYIVRKYCDDSTDSETRIYKDFSEVINWVAWIFDERRQGEKIVKISTEAKNG